MKFIFITQTNDFNDALFYNRNYTWYAERQENIKFVHRWSVGLKSEEVKQRESERKKERSERERGREREKIKKKKSLILKFSATFHYQDERSEING